MKELSDAEIQNLVSQGHDLPAGEGSTEDMSDLATYRLLFEALEDLPASSLPPDFAARVTASLVPAPKPATDVAMYLAIAVIFAALLTGTFVYMMAGHGEESSQIFLALVQYKWILLFAIAAFCLVQFADHRLLRNQPL